MVQFRLWHLDPIASGRKLGWGLVFAHEDGHNCDIMQPSLELTNPSSSYSCALRSLAKVWHTVCFRQFFGDAKPRSRVSSVAVTVTECHSLDGHGRGKFH
jgi:hypothetical protein